MKPLPTLAIDWPGLSDRIGVVSTLRAGGVSAAPYDDGGHGGAHGGGLNLGIHVGDAPQAVARNRALLRALLPAEPAWLTQVHGVAVVDAKAAAAQPAPPADASVATERGVVCAIMTADCMPVLFADREGRAVAAAHAGWRGLAGGVLENTVGRLREAGAEELLVWLGPVIGPTQFEVGEEVVQAFEHLGASAQPAFRPVSGKEGKYLADLPALARRVLAGVGVTAVSGGQHCTVSEPERFYSFRRDRVTGRMATLIWIK